MKSLIKSFDELPWIVKLILCIPVVDIIWSVYKIIRSLNSENILYVILGILTIVPGAVFMWIIDLVTVLLTKKVWWIC